MKIVERLLRGLNICNTETREYFIQDVGTNRILKTELSWFTETYFTDIFSNNCVEMKLKLKSDMLNVPSTPTEIWEYVVLITTVLSSSHVNNSDLHSHVNVTLIVLDIWTKTWRCCFNHL